MGSGRFLRSLFINVLSQRLAFISFMIGNHSWFPCISLNSHPTGNSDSNQAQTQSWEQSTSPPYWINRLKRIFCLARLFLIRSPHNVAQFLLCFSNHYESLVNYFCYLKCDLSKPIYSAINANSFKSVSDCFSAHVCCQFWILLHLMLHYVAL